MSPSPSDIIKDAQKSHWVYRAPQSWRPYLQLSRLDRPIGYWLLALPGWIGLAFAGLSRGLESADLKWAVLLFIGAVAMRGAGCTYNDIVDQDLDRQVTRTALRPLPAGTITTKQAWIWLFAQCFIGLAVLLCLPRLAQIIALCAIPLVAAYPFMKRITWWQQIWLGLTFNWAVLVAYAIKTSSISQSVLILYAGLIFWTVGYDTVYACQDKEDDALIGIKSTARRFGAYVRPAVAICFIVMTALLFRAIGLEIIQMANPGIEGGFWSKFARTQLLKPAFGLIALLCALLLSIAYSLDKEGKNALGLFKLNRWIGFYIVSLLICLNFLWGFN